MGDHSETFVTNANLHIKYRLITPRDIIGIALYIGSAHSPYKNALYGNAKLLLQTYPVVPARAKKFEINDLRKTNKPIRTERNIPTIQKPPKIHAS